MRSHKSWRADISSVKSGLLSTLSPNLSASIPMHGLVSNLVLEVLIIICGKIHNLFKVLHKCPAGQILMKAVQNAWLDQVTKGIHFNSFVANFSHFLLLTVKYLTQKKGRNYTGCFTTLGHNCRR